jgi:hypothetical protein
MTIATINLERSMTPPGSDHESYKPGFQFVRTAKFFDSSMPDYEGGGGGSLVRTRLTSKFPDNRENTGNFVDLAALGSTCNSLPPCPASGPLSGWVKVAAFAVPRL